MEQKMVTNNHNMPIQETKQKTAKVYTLFF